jgi:hypothetical protein
VQRHRLGRQQIVYERRVGVGGQRQVEVVARSVLVARGAKRDLAIDRVGVQDRRQRIVEVQISLAQERLQRLRQLGVRQRARGQHDDSTVGNARHTLAAQLDARMGLDRRGHAPRERLAVHRERPARRHRSLVGRRQHQRPQLTHLRLQQPHRIAQLVGAQRIAAHQLEPCAGEKRTGFIS